MDKYSQQKGKAFALRSEMGYSLEETGQKVRIPSFVIVHTLDWVGKQIKMGSEMPFMQSHIDSKGRLVVDESIAESVKQRAPDWRRQPAISAYLAHDKSRKFGTIIAVLNPTWVDDPTHQNWGPGTPEPRALKSAFNWTPLDARGQIGVLDLDDVLMYALDGQHRVMGIRGLQELLDGHLQIRNQDGTVKPKADVIKKDEFLKMFNMDVGGLQGLLNETITIELIPAVLAGETRSESSQRVRSVFITINAYAQRTEKSETTLLDESDGFAIVARKAGTLHPLFKNDRVNWKTSTLPQRTRWYTTLETLKDMATEYLLQVHAKLKNSWQPKFKGQVPIRPEEEEVETARQEFFAFLDHVRSLPVFEGLDSGDDLDEVRQFPDGRTNGTGHLLVRPVGQIILAKAVGILIREGYSLDDIFAKLRRWDADGGFRQHVPESIWYGITYDFSGNKMNTRTNQNMGAKLLAYMVRGAKEDERLELLSFVVEARDLGKPDEKAWRDFHGNEHKYDPADPWKGKSLPRPIE
jgi:DGQHR domain-containing protein